MNYTEAPALGRVVEGKHHKQNSGGVRSTGKPSEERGIQDGHTRSWRGWFKEHKHWRQKQEAVKNLLVCKGVSPCEWWQEAKVPSAYKPYALRGQCRSWSGQLVLDTMLFGASRFGASSNWGFRNCGDGITVAFCSFSVWVWLQLVTMHNVQNKCCLLVTQLGCLCWTLLTTQAESTAVFPALRWWRSGQKWSGLTRACSLWEEGSAIIKAGNVASQTVSAHPANITCHFRNSWVERGVTSGG